MHQMTQPAAALRGGKSRNKNIRMTPAVADAIDAAAAAVGLDVTAFITSVAFQEAQRITAQHQRTVLPNDVFADFAAAVTAEGTPNARLAALAQQKRARLSDD